MKNISMLILKNVYFMLLKIKMNNTIDTCIHCERFVRRRQHLIADWQSSSFRCVHSSCHCPNLSCESMEGKAGEMRKGGETRKDGIRVEPQGAPSEAEIIMRSVFLFHSLQPRPQTVDTFSNIFFLRVVVNGKLESHPILEGTPVTSIVGVRSHYCL